MNKIIISMALLSVAMLAACAGTGSRVRKYTGPKMPVAVIDVDIAGTRKGDHIQKAWETTLIPQAEIELFQTNRFQVINRNKLESIIKEQQLSLTGLIEAKDYSQIGKLGGLEGVVVLTALGHESGKVTLTCNLYDTSTASLKAAAKVEAESKDTISAALSECSNTLANQLIPEN